MMALSCSTSGGPIQDYVNTDKIKIVYFYFRPYLNQKYEPEYRVIYSSSWKKQFGSILDDPLISFTRARNIYPFIGDGLPDSDEQGVGAKWFANKIISMGFLDLPAANTKSFSQEYLVTVAANQTFAPNFRVIWLSTDKISRIVLLTDLLSSNEHYLKFAKIENIVNQYMIAYTMQTSVFK